MLFIKLNPPANRSQPLFLSAHLRSVPMSELIEDSRAPFSPDCGRALKMVHFGDNKMTDPCHCPDQTFGVGGVGLDGALCSLLVGFRILQRFCALVMSPHTKVLQCKYSTWMIISLYVYFQSNYLSFPLHSKPCLLMHCLF